MLDSVTEPKGKLSEEIVALMQSQNTLTIDRLREIGRYRLASRMLGSYLTGKVCNVLGRSGVLRPESKVYYVLCTDPLVVYLGNKMRHTFEIAELLRHRRVHFIKNSYHTFENPARLAPLAREWDEFQRTYPQHTIDFICPTEHELEMFEEAGIRPAHFINKNAFVDENQYRILADVRREYHAIYNGQLKPYKRHELAEAIGNLALIVYRSHTNNLEAAEAYERDIRVRLKHATWLNDLGGFIAPCEISTFLNRARVGLCLSAEEGPMAACMEYFLSGLAVVSTRSLGGREVFFDDQYVRVVDDHPEAVARGVDELIDADISPALIREKTIQKMQVHRDRFIALVNSVIERGGGTPDFHDRFASLFVNKLRAAAPFPGAFLTHISRGMPVELCRQFAAMRNA